MPKERYPATVVVLAILLASWLLLRGAGAVGVRELASWRDSGRWALALMLIFTASAHFTSTRHDLVKMVPDWVPYQDGVIFLTGILEIAGAIGILLPHTRRVAGICLCLLLAAMFTANVKASREGLTIAGSPVTALFSATSDADRVYLARLVVHARPGHAATACCRVTTGGWLTLESVFALLVG